MANTAINPIKKRRKERGLTQVDMALLIGVSQVHISQFETGGLIPHEAQIKEVAKILGLDQKMLNKELYQFYEDKKRELRKRILGEPK